MKTQKLLSLLIVTAAGIAVSNAQPASSPHRSPPADPAAPASPTRPAAKADPYAISGSTRVVPPAEVRRNTFSDALQRDLLGRPTRDMFDIGGSLVVPPPADAAHYSLKGKRDMFDIGGSTRIEPRTPKPDTFSNALQRDLLGRRERDMFDIGGSIRIDPPPR